VRRVAIVQGRDIQNIRCNRRQLEVRCQDGCPWRLYASVIEKKGSVAIKQLHKEHVCHRNVHTRQLTAQWIAEEF
ncbi:Unknown protein, partial [Striga hermonthica]